MEQIEKLNERVSVVISPAHRFGTDAFLLAHFAAPRRKDVACDLCTGCGIIPLIWANGDAPRESYGVELQPAAAGQFRRSIELSGVGQRVHCIESDLKELKGKLPFAQFDLVSCNPPYKAAGSGIESGMEAERIARHEVCCTTEDVCKAAAQLLRFGGRLCLCQRPERLADVLCAMRSAGIEPKRLRFVAKHADTEPWLFLVEGKKGAKPFMRVEPVLAVEEKSGGFTKEVLMAYGKV